MASQCFKCWERVKTRLGCRGSQAVRDRMILNLPGKDMARPINLVTTARYTFWNFLFKCGAEQFRNLSNVYFLLISILALLGTRTNLFESPYSAAGTLLGLILVLSFTMAFEGYYDIKRHREDKEVNNRIAYRLRPGDGLIEEIPWSEVRPGDLLKVKDRSQFPADLLFVTSCAQGHKCYVETANIDGETNLKIKTVPKALVEYCMLPDVASSLQAKVEYDLPSSFLTFSGTIRIYDDKANDNGYIDIPLDFSNLLLRGSVLRNTPWILGYVLYAGKETKVVQSSSNPPTKMSRIQKLVNKIIKIILVVGVIMCVVSSLAEIFGFPSNTEIYYLMQPSDNAFILPRFLADMCTFIVLYSSLLPISLLFCMTFSNFFQAMFVHWDMDMYHEETDTPAKCNTMELVQELGQVSYVFSDKTGTLTRNEMKLVGMSVNGITYGIGNGAEDTASSSACTIREIFADVIRTISISPEEEARDEEAKKEKEALLDFLTVLSVCHTVLVDTTSGPIQYNAEGPDEEALVSAAAEVGSRLTATDNGCHYVRTELGDVYGTFADDDDEKGDPYEIMAVNQFNSTRKRMSVVCKTPDGRYVLLAKGADNVMFELARPPSTDDELEVHQCLMKHLDAFANDGLRTLVMGKRYLDESEYVSWKERYDQASNALGETRAALLSDAAEAIEKDLTIIGASAIEDRLQDGVPETLVALREAGVKTWVLTGDKVETAINISFSARLFTPDMELVQITSDEQDENLKTLKQLHDLLIPENLCKDSEQRKKGREAIHTSFLKTGSKAVHNVAATSLHTFELAGRSVEKAGRATMDVVQKTSRAALSTFKFLRSPEPGDTDDNLRKRAKSENEIDVIIDGVEKHPKIVVEGALEVEEEDHEGGEKDDNVGIDRPSSPYHPQQGRARAGTSPADSSSRNLNIYLDESDSEADEQDMRDPLTSNASSSDAQSFSSRKLKKKRRSIPSFKKFLRNFSANKSDQPSPGGNSPKKNFSRQESRRMSKWQTQGPVLPPGVDSEEAENINERELKGTEKNLEGFEAKNMALIISGGALRGLLQSELGTEETEQMLLSIAKLCSVVVACRVSPKQKALVVRMVKEGVQMHDGSSPITLAIGDGANDVAMIQEARVGIGISGHEGRQAVNSSDFAIAQFRFLQQLMLVHGRWNYRRAASMVLYVFYANILFVLTAFVYNFTNKFSGSALNFVFLITVYSYPTQVPIAVVACLNRDISKKTALDYPAMYISGRRNLHLNKGQSLEWIFKSFFHAFLICAITIIWAAPMGASLSVMGTATYVACVYVCVSRSILETYTFTALNWFVIGFGYISMLVFEPIYYGNDPSIYILYGPTVLWGRNGEPEYIWTAVTLATMMCVCSDIFIMYLRREFDPSLVDIVIEIDRGYGDESINKKSRLKKVNKLFRKIAQPLMIPQNAISELLAAANIRNVKRAAHRSAFDYDHPEDEIARIAKATMTMVRTIKNTSSVSAPAPSGKGVSLTSSFAFSPAVVQEPEQTIEMHNINRVQPDNSHQNMNEDDDQTLTDNSESSHVFHNVT